ncbi:hypothetical protein BV509_00775 [Rhodovulum sulfidophilum]|uniref:Ribosomally synthesized peptide with nif11-like leader n=1 Tax=Rhodovulum visakhapatnamense TaxID=364297 RepID=A0ABS1RKT6_9RHOB|nr:hypothetical protein [Rhodovulum visakhapatnamense]MBL3569869.1 hypothetical protein [Rhodovulum visakhapatnamense]MBL3580266.1 hypothetical protein [Rhodovulum visakhapatnamense]OLS43026.1 hypothetical protein BV509_00775 [Rhodovulum sulfidophilum]
METALTTAPELVDFVAEWRSAAPEVQLAAIRGALRRQGIAQPSPDDPARAGYEIQLFGLAALGRDEADAARTWMDAAARRCPFD